MSINFDFGELNALAADLGDVGREAMPNIKKAVEVTARHIKDDWRKGARRTGLGPYAAAISYDMKLEDSSIGAEIGPVLGGMGAFGFVEDGGSGVKSAPQHAARKAAKGNEADFEKGLLKAIGDIL